MKLSAIQIEQAKPKEKDYKLFDGEGLFFLIKKNGSKYWRLNCSPSAPMEHSA